MNKVVCNNGIEFLSSINSHTHLQLKKGQYDISDIVLAYDKNIFFSDHEVGPHGDRELIIRNSTNITIEGIEDDISITSRYPYANIMTFVDCSDISINNIFFGHYPEMGYCCGGVLVFINCTNVSINKCTMFGCGTMGITCVNCSNVSVADSLITKCNTDMVFLEESTECRFTNTRMMNNETRTLKILHCDQIYFTNCRFQYNDIAEWDENPPLFTIGNSSGKIVLSSSYIDVSPDDLVNYPDRLETSNNTYLE